MLQPPLFFFGTWSGNIFWKQPWLLGYLRNHVYLLRFWMKENSTRFFLLFWMEALSFIFIYADSQFNFLKSFCFTFGMHMVIYLLEIKHTVDSSQVTLLSISFCARCLHFIRYFDFIWGFSWIFLLWIFWTFFIKNSYATFILGTTFVIECLVFF